MNPSNLIEADDVNFDYEVLAYSNSKPVVVEFWAAWCQPCKWFSPLVEKTITAANGAVRLARVDVDASPNLALRYGVRTLPTLKAFVQGQVAAEMVGAQPEKRIADFWAALQPPSPSRLELEKALSLYQQRRLDEAETLLRAVLEEEPNDPASLLGLVKVLLSRGKTGPAMNILNNFPDSRELARAEILKPLGLALADLHAGNLPQGQDQDAAYQRALLLASRGNLPAALDGLMDILRVEKRYRGGAAHKVILSLLELMGEDDPEARQYRSELASLLF